MDALTYRADEYLSVCHQRGDEFRSAVMAPGAAPRYAVELGSGADMWFGVNPTSGPVREGGGRGRSEDVTRLAALFCDLDVKPNACPDFDTAERIIDGISSVLGQRPSVVVFSGHGLQPYWPVDDGDITDMFTTADAATLLSRFGRLVGRVADEHKVKCDAVFDLARVLRVPGTVNHKSTPVSVTARSDLGGPLTVAEADERLTEVGIAAEAVDIGSQALVSPSADWVFADQTCSYVAAIVDGLATDAPTSGRNPWACSQAVRLCCAWRLGCITREDFGRAVTALETRLSTLLATTEPRRGLRRYELRDVLALGQQRAERKSEDEARAELGGHRHMGSADDFWGTGTEPSINGAGIEPDPPADERPAYAGLLLTRSALRSLPEPEPLIDDVLDQGTCAVLYGYRGSLKSFTAFDWGASVATGRPWQGRRTVQRRALYVAAEGAHGYPGRADAWEIGWQRQISDGALDVLPRPVNLMVPAEVSELAALIEWGSYGFVILDTLARCMVGGDENSSRDMGTVVDRLYHLLDKTPDRRGVILGVHHTGKDGKTLRGSSALDAGVDTVYAAVREGSTVTLSREKRKDGPEPDRHALALDPIPGTGSCTLKAVHEGVSAPGETPERSAQLRLIVSQHFVSTGATGAELRRLAVDDGGMSRASYYRALSDLLQFGYLVNTGTDSRPFYKVNDE
ncbi:AAA family ATPase [Mycolicibacterium litorale]|uniref:AAA family ATPase n=1 Tax=Mycolicibacterium litorale TaxID=758802 RepID=UPI0016269DEE|nr:AAA family ATPase [Mycolicibacterium litorale]